MNLKLGFTADERLGMGEQEFFAKDMGLPLTMTPNYDDFSCQFSFGVTPPPPEADEALATPCFLQCPSKRQAVQTEHCGGIAL
jgi:Beta-carotene isomerase D27-like, C-terminal